MIVDVYRTFFVSLNAKRKRFKW